MAPRSRNTKRIASRPGPGPRGPRCVSRRLRAGVGPWLPELRDPGGWGHSCEARAIHRQQRPHELLAPGCEMVEVLLIH